MTSTLKPTSHTMHTLRPAILLAALSLVISCSDDAHNTSPFDLDDPRPDLGAPDMTNALDMAPEPDQPAEEPRLRFTALAVGAGHICALTDTGALYCWGRNTSGQVGVGSDADSVPTPTLVPGMERDVSAISAAGQSTCAVKDSALYCWGLNSAPLVDAQPAVLRTPTLNPNLERSVSAVSTSGAHTCAVQAGAVLCWGQNDRRQLGYEVASKQPTILDRVTGEVTSVSVGADRSCAISDGALWCWGDDTAYLRDGDAADPLLAPTLLREADPAVEPDKIVVQVGRAHSCLLSGQTVSCWGRNTKGQLGTPGSSLRQSDSDAPLFARNVSVIAADADRTCMNRDSGIYCWGDLTYGLFDEPWRRALDNPRHMENMERALSAVAVGPYNTCAIFARSTIICHGDAQFGQLPEPSSTGIRIKLQ